MHMISILLAAALTLTPGTTEIVVDKAAPKATLIAANEMQGLLGKVLGGEVPIVREPAAGHVSIVLGTNGWSVAAGLHPETLRRDGRDLAVHADIDDEVQTVYVPSIRTTLCGNGDAHEVLAAESIQLVDTVTYEGLEPHTSYRMRGRLVDVQTGETLHDKNNAEIIVEEPFEAETSSGQIALRFTIDARDLAGKTVVCFEQLITGTEDFERIVARHEDPRDANQTVTFPKIATSASDAE